MFEVIDPILKSNDLYLINAGVPGQKRPQKGHKGVLFFIKKEYKGVHNLPKRSTKEYVFYKTYHNIHPIARNFSHIK